MAQRLELSSDQQHRLDGIFQQNRLKLIDLSAALQKEEATMEPLLEAEHPDEARIVEQIDRIAQARADLEKTNARMLLGFRGVLSQDQWKKLQAQRGPGPPPMRH
jgi:Spy/CpxP family protein refolding chaperone